MLDKQSFQKWAGRKPKITDVIIPNKSDLFNNFGFQRKVKKFVGQSSTFAFAN